MAIFWTLQVGFKNAPPLKGELDELARTEFQSAYKKWLLLSVPVNRAYEVNSVVFNNKKISIIIDFEQVIYIYCETFQTR
jgi:hypothetical protein